MASDSLLQVIRNTQLKEQQPEEEPEPSEEEPAPEEGEEEGDWDDFVDKEEMNALLKQVHAKPLSGTKEKIDTNPKLKEYVGPMSSIRQVLIGTPPEQGPEQLDEFFMDWLSKLGLFGSKKKAEVFATELSLMKSKMEMVKVAKEMAKAMGEEDLSPEDKKAKAFAKFTNESGFDDDEVAQMMKEGDEDVSDETIKKAQKFAKEDRDKDPDVAVKFAQAAQTKKKYYDEKKSEAAEATGEVTQELDRNLEDANAAAGKSGREAENAKQEKEKLEKGKKELEDKIKLSKTDASKTGLDQMRQNTAVAVDMKKAKEELLKKKEPEPPADDGGEEKPADDGEESSKTIALFPPL